MAENVVDLLNKIAEVRGEEYAQGMVDMANLLTPKHPEEEAKNEAHPA